MNGQKQDGAQEEQTLFEAECGSTGNHTRYDALNFAGVKGSLIHRDMEKFTAGNGVGISYKITGFRSDKGVSSAEGFLGAGCTDTGFLKVDGSLEGL